MAVKNISFIHCVLRITAAKRIQIMYLYSHAGRLTQPTAIRHYYRERERERAIRCAQWAWSRRRPATNPIKSKIFASNGKCKHILIFYAKFVYIVLTAVCAWWKCCFILLAQNEGERAYTVCEWREHIELNVYIKMAVCERIVGIRDVYVHSHHVLWVYRVANHRSCCIYTGFRVYIIAMSPRSVYLMCRESECMATANAINKQCRKKRVFIRTWVVDAHSICGAIMLNKQNVNEVRCGRGEFGYQRLKGLQIKPFHPIFRCDNAPKFASVQSQVCAIFDLFGIWIEINFWPNPHDEATSATESQAFATFLTPLETLLCKSSAINSNESNKNNNWSNADVHVDVAM